MRTRRLVSAAVGLAAVTAVQLADPPMALATTTDDFTIGEALPSGGGGPAGIALDAVNSTLWVTNTGANDVGVLDRVSGALLGTIPVGAHPNDVALDPDGTMAYVVNGDDNSVSVIDTASRTVTATLGVGRGPDFVAVDPRRHQALASDYTSSRIDV